tara:strand:- start:13757 stop:14071 length:315 start_codon:yes stop_codon:yes gene_type:complete
MIEDIFDKINTNKYFVGFMMIILTIGGRFIISELTEEQREKIDTPVFRKLFIFCAFFMATRDLIITILLTIAFLFFLESINFNKNESFEDDYETHDSLGIFVNY